MIAFVIILLTTALGMAGQPLWVALVGGLLLATTAVVERRALQVPEGSTRQLELLTLSASGSLVIALTVSTGAFAIGRALAVLLS